MKNKLVLTKISIGIDALAITVLLIYFLVVKTHSPITSLAGLLILSPPIFGVIGLITAIQGKSKPVRKIDILLIIVNIIFICWWPIFWIGGTLLLGQ